MVKKIRWVGVEVSGASSDVEGNCTTFYSAGPPATITITNTLGKKSKVGLKKDGAKVTVCDGTGVATVDDGT